MNKRQEPLRSSAAADAEQALAVDGGARHVRHRNIVGKLINFRGLVYAPVNENGVIFVFGRVAADLNMYVETIRPGYPDCVAKRYIGKGKWEELRIEFEFRSSHFVAHKHHPGDCDAIVCWIHDWPECPKSIEVIELQSVISQLPNPAMEEPDKVTELSEHNVGDLLPNKDQRGLYDGLHERIMKLDSDIWRKVGERLITYYSPQRVFAYVSVAKMGLRLVVFTNGRRLRSVEQIEHEEGGQKWGRIYAKTKADYPDVIRALTDSHKRIVAAVKRGGKTGWWAERDA
jgi:hypothetical protein